MRKRISKSSATIGGLTVDVVLKDITSEVVDAITNAANDDLMHGGGVAGAISRKCGSYIQKESNKWVYENGTVKTGTCGYTSGGQLNCKYVIHAVGLMWSNKVPK